MGCDIHIYTERKVQGRWIMVESLKWDSPARDRNYDRFAALCGVRGEGPAPRGFPDDASESTRYHREDWEGDGHSHSWMPLPEACKVWLETDRNPTDFAKEFPAAHYFNVDGGDSPHDDWRVVFWFDN